MAKKATTDSEISSVHKPTELEQVSGRKLTFDFGNLSVITLHDQCRAFFKFTGNKADV